ncbi:MULTISPECIES: hypothetical protein [Acidiplasma]|nr:hypothetical protein [Acidiplasma aeolicum]
MKIKTLVMILLGFILIMDSILLYSKYSYMYYPVPINYSASAKTAIVFTVFTTVLIIIGAILISLGIYKIIRENYVIPKINHYWLISLIYGIIIAIIGGMIHIAPSGFHYPHYVSFTYGLPMFVPNFMIYYSRIIGLYMYPLQLLSLVAVSLTGAAIMGISFKGIRSRKKSVASILGTVGVCPACAAGTLFGFVIGASPFLSSFYLNVLYGNTLDEVLISMLSLLLMFIFLLYVLKPYKIKTKIIRSAPLKN